MVCKVKGGRVWSWVPCHRQSANGSAHWQKAPALQRTGIKAARDSIPAYPCCSYRPLQTCRFVWMLVSRNVRQIKSLQVHRPHKFSDTQRCLQKPVCFSLPTQPRNSNPMPEPASPAKPRQPWSCSAQANVGQRSPRAHASHCSPGLSWKSTHNSPSGFSAKQSNHWQPRLGPSRQPSSTQSSHCPKQCLSHRLAAAEVHWCRPNAGTALPNIVNPNQRSADCGTCHCRPRQAWILQITTAAP